MKVKVVHPSCCTFGFTITLVKVTFRMLIILQCIIPIFMNFMGIMYVLSAIMTTVTY